MVENKIHLFYWAGIRGAAQPLRYALEFASIAYEQTLYSNDEDWFKRDKPTLPMLLPNLPYIKDGDVLMSEHDALVRYVARKFKPELLGANDADNALVENIFGFWTKTYGQIVTLSYTPDVSEEQREAFLKKFENQLNKLDTHLSTNKFYAGDSVTIADLYGLHAYGALTLIHPATTDELVNLNRHRQELESQEWYVNFKNSDRFSDQFNGDEASINNKQ